MAIPFLNHINLSNNEVQNVRLHNTASITVSSGLGHLYFDTDDSLAKYYRANNDWVTIDPITSISLTGTTLTLGRVQTDLEQDLSSIVPSDVVVGTGAAGQVAYWSATDTITGENDFGWDATNNRLGIGVGLSPTANLDIDRNVADLATSLALTDTRASVKIVGSTQDSQLTFSHGSFGIEQIQASNQAGNSVKDLSLNPYGGNVYVNAMDSGAATTASLVMGSTGTSTSQINMNSSTGTNDGSIINVSHKLTIRTHNSATEQIVLDENGHVHFKTYGSGSVTGTAAKNLSITSAGKIIETDAVPANIVETVTTTDGTYIELTPNSATDGAVTITADLSAVDGTSGANERYLTKTNKWATVDSITGTTYDLAVAAGGSNDAAIELTGSDSTTDTVTIEGTSSTVKVTESGNTITLDLQDNVTIAQNLTVTGNLTVDGSTTTVESTVTTFTDPIIELNRVADGGTQGDPTTSSGIQVNRAGAGDGSSLDVQLVWMEDTDDWEFQAYNHESTPVIKKYKLPTSFKATIGGATSIAVNHYLGTRDVIEQLYDTSSYETVYADVTRTNEQTVTIDFVTAPGAGDVTVLIISAQGEQ